MSTKYSQEFKLEWDYKKNDFLPDSVTLHSAKKVWWKCDKGHSWEATIDSRSSGAGCPYCNGNRRKIVRNIDTNKEISITS